MSKGFADLVEEGDLGLAENGTQGDEEELETMGLKETGKRQASSGFSVYDGLHEIQNRTFPEGGRRWGAGERYPFCIVWTPLPGLT